MFQDIILDEEWRDIAGFEGLYRVSSLGRIKSLSRPVYRKKGRGILVERILKPYLTNGYPTVSLYGSEGVKLEQRVHVIVGRTFLPKLLDKFELNHIDHDKTNPRLDNLEWVTHKENAEKAVVAGRMSGRTNSNRAKKLTPDLVEALRRGRAEGATFAGLAAEFGLSIGTVHATVTGKYWS